MDIIIVLLIVVLVMIGLRSTKKHLKGRGGCCGGGSAPTPVPEKKLDHVIGQKIVIVDGMTCQHCKNWVEKSINEIEGAAAKVNLRHKEAIVSYEKEISDDVIRAAVKKAGYRVAEIR